MQLSEVDQAVWQALMGTLFTWGMTAAGAGLVFVLEGGQRKILDASLGFAAGVMMAASFWSLLQPAIELVEETHGAWAFLPAAIGFVLGGGFVYLADVTMPLLGISGDVMESITQLEKGTPHENTDIFVAPREEASSEVFESVRQRRGQQTSGTTDQIQQDKNQNEEQRLRDQSWKRILLLIIAITVHNIPEGLAVGVGFGAVGKSPSASYENAWNLALAIGIQNFPEGLAVSLPLKAAGMSTLKSFWYGQLSGMVEPLAAVFGALAIKIAEPLLPYALAFAAGAMIYVVVDDIIPEAHTSGNGRLSTFGVMVGFLAMMSLDVGLG